MNNHKNGSNAFFRETHSLNGEGYLFSREKIRALKKRPATKKAGLDSKSKSLSVNEKKLEENTMEVYGEESAVEIIRKRNTPIKECDLSELSQFFNIKFSEMLLIN